MKSNGSKRAYLTICTENYHYLANYLGQSINKFSNYDLHVFCVNYSPAKDQKLPGVFYHRMDYEIQNQDAESFSVSQDGNFYVNRENIRSFQIMTRKYAACLKMLEMDFDECCYIDCDSLASPFVDEIFDFLPQIDSTPVFTKGPHDYMMVTVNGQVMRGDPFVGTWPIPDNTKTLEWPLRIFSECSQRKEVRMLMLIFLRSTRIVKIFYKRRRNFLTPCGELQMCSGMLHFKMKQLLMFCYGKKKLKYSLLFISTLAALRP